jgi:acetoin utilization protein AcuC
VSNPVFFYSDKLLDYDMGPHHPMRPVRLRMTYDLLAAYGAFESGLKLESPEPAWPEDVTAVHDVGFVDAVRRLSAGEGLRSADRYGFGTGDNPIFPGMYEASMRYTGASLQAAQAVMDGARVAVNIAGGLHHAHFDHAAGFCVLNDCAVAARRLRSKFKRVAYVDIDVHHGDGVQELFYSDPSVLTISLHESGRTLFPGSGFTYETGEGAGIGYSLNLPFGPYTTDEVWLDAWRAAALPVLRAFAPEAIVMQLGADPHALDPLAHMCLSAQGWLEAVKDVQTLGVPIVALGGGGYNLTTVTRMWALAVGQLAGLDLPNATPASFRYHAEIPTLLDREPHAVDPESVERARKLANRAVEELRSQPFPSRK